MLVYVKARGQITIHDTTQTKLQKTVISMKTYLKLPARDKYSAMTITFNRSPIKRGGAVKFAIGAVLRFYGGHGQI